MKADCCPCCSRQVDCRWKKVNMWLGVGEILFSYFLFYFLIERLTSWVKSRDNFPQCWAVLLPSEPLYRSFNVIGNHTNQSEMLSTATGGGAKADQIVCCFQQPLMKDPRWIIWVTYSFTLWMIDSCMTTIHCLLNYSSILIGDVRSRGPFVHVARCSTLFFIIWHILLIPTTQKKKTFCPRDF